MTRVTGVDLSLTGTGLCVAEPGDPTGDSVTVVTAKPPKGLADLPRLRWLRGEVVAACEESDLVVLEGLAFSTRTGKASERAGLWWLVVDALDALNIPVAVMPPASVKTYATGKGNADKDTVLADTVRRYPSVLVRDNNQADALVLAAAGLDHTGAPLTTLPATHRRALTGVAWPTTPTGADT